MFIDPKLQPPNPDRRIYIRRHGDGFRVTVEPHPFISDDMQGLDRRCDSIGAARAWAHGTEQRKGWPVVDESGVGPTPPRPAVKRARPAKEDCGGCGHWSCDPCVAALTRASFSQARQRRK